MTAQTMSYRYELACKGHSSEKSQDLVTQQNDLCCFIGFKTVVPNIVSSVSKLGVLGLKMS